MMTSACDIDMNEYNRDDLKPNELVFGIVKPFTYIYYIFKYNNKRDNCIVIDLELLKVVWLIKPDTRTTHTIDMLRIYTKIVAKK